MKKTVVTGGAGFIGSHLAEFLAENGHDVVILDNFRRNSLSSVPELTSRKNVSILDCSVLDKERVKSALIGAENVLHLAAIAGVSSYYSNPLQVLNVNILGTVNVLEACVATGVKQYIHFSTSEVYGSAANNAIESQPTGIGAVQDKRWVYATSKLTGEQFSLRYGEEYNFKVSAIRPFNVYGPRQTGEGAIRNFCKAAIGGEPLRIEGDGKDVRSWCYIDDFVGAVLRMLETDAANGKSFNIGNPYTALTTHQLAEKVIEINGGGVVERIPMPHVPIRERVPNIDLAREILGFDPVCDMNFGLAKTLEWTAQYDH